VHFASSADRQTVCNVITTKRLDLHDTSRYHLCVFQVIINRIPADWQWLRGWPRWTWLQTSKINLWPPNHGQSRWFDGVVYNLWLLVTFKISGAWMSSRLDFSQKSRTSCAVEDLAWLEWTMPRPEARQTKLIWEPAWPVRIPRHLLELWAWAGVWRDRMLLSERKEVPYGTSPMPLIQCHSHPCTSPTLTSQHTDKSSNWHPAPIKTIMRHLLTQTSVALGDKNVHWARFYTASAPVEAISLQVIPTWYHRVRFLLGRPWKQRLVWQFSASAEASFHSCPVRNSVCVKCMYACVEAATIIATVRVLCLWELCAVYL